MGSRFSLLVSSESTVYRQIIKGTLPLLKDIKQTSLRSSTNSVVQLIAMTKTTFIYRRDLRSSTSSVVRSIATIETTTIYIRDLRSSAIIIVRTIALTKTTAIYKRVVRLTASRVRSRAVTKPMAV